jgi:type IV secretory pathway TrbL component
VRSKCGFKPVLLAQNQTGVESYIDSQFGLLGGDIAFLASTLIAIDVRRVRPE